MRQNGTVRSNGVIVDQAPIDVAPEYWTEATNMIAKPVRMQRARGYGEVYETALNNVRWLLYAEQLGVPYWLYCGGNAAAVVDQNNVHTSILTGYPVTVDTGDWTGGILNGVAIFHGLGGDGYYWYSGIAGGQALILPGLRPGVRYNAMRCHRDHIFGLGVTDGATELPDQIHWSDGAVAGTVPSTWVPAADNEANDANLTDEGGVIVDGATLRDAFYIYKRDSVWSATFVGGDLVYSIRKVFSNTGVLARNCIARVKGTHVVLGNGDIYRHDGQNIEPLGEGKVKRAFFASINSGAAENSFVVYNEAQEEVWFCAPRGTQSRPSLALVWDVQTDEWGYRELPLVNYAATGIVNDTGVPVTWDGQTGSWGEQTAGWGTGFFRLVEESVLMCDQTDGGKFYLGDSSLKAAGQDFTSALARYSLDLGDKRVKAIRRIWPHIESSETVTFKMELFDQQAPHRGQTKLAELAFTSEDEGIPLNVNARYFGVRISTEEAADWSCAGFDLEWFPRGRF